MDRCDFPRCNCAARTRRYRDGDIVACDGMINKLRPYIRGIVRNIIHSASGGLGRRRSGSILEGIQPVRLVERTMPFLLLGKACRDPSSPRPTTARRSPNTGRVAAAFLRHRRSSSIPDSCAGPPGVHRKSPGRSPSGMAPGFRPDLQARHASSAGSRADEHTDPDTLPLADTNP